MVISFLKLDNTGLNKSISEINNKNPLSTNKTNNQIQQKKQKSTRYILEGKVIKVYVTNEEGIEKCVKMIPLEAATPDLLAKVECASFVDLMFLNEVKSNQNEERGSIISYDKNGEIGELKKRKINIEYKL